MNAIDEVVDQAVELLNNKRVRASEKSLGEAMYTAHGRVHRYIFKTQVPLRDVLVDTVALHMLIRFLQRQSEPGEFLLFVQSERLASALVDEIERVLKRVKWLHVVRHSLYDLWLSDGTERFMAKLYVCGKRAYLRGASASRVFIVNDESEYIWREVITPLSEITGSRIILLHGAPLDRLLQERYQRTTRKRMTRKRKVAPHVEMK